MMSSTKPEVHNVSQTEISWRTDTHTHRRTHRNTLQLLLWAK